MFRVGASAKRFRGQLPSLLFIHWRLLVPVSGRINIVCIPLMRQILERRERPEKNRIITRSRGTATSSRKSPRRSNPFFIKILSRLVRALFEHEHCKIEMFPQHIRSAIRGCFSPSVKSRRNTAWDSSPRQRYAANKTSPRFSVF